MSKWTFCLIVAQALDALTFAAFYLYVGAGAYAEVNPLAVALLAIGGVQLVVFIKISIAVIVSWRMDHTTVPMTRTYRRVRAVVMSIAAISGLIGASFNILAITRSI